MITDTNGTPLTKVIFDSFEEAEKQSKGFMSKTEIVILYLTNKRRNHRIPIGQKFKRENFKWQGKDPTGVFL
jgi:hypothetical protein